MLDQHGYITVVASILMVSQILLLLEVFHTFITLVDILWPLTAHLWSSILVLPSLGFLINIIPIAGDMVAVGPGQHHLRADPLLVPPHRLPILFDSLPKMKLFFNISINLSLVISTTKLPFKLIQRYCEGMCIGFTVIILAR